MDNLQLIIVFDAMLYLLTFIYWAFKLKKINAGLGILLIMCMSHVGAIFYYRVLYEFGFDLEFGIIPFVFLYLMIMMNLYPFLKHDGIREIDVTGNERFIKVLSIFVILITVEPFFENIKVLLTSKAEYSDVYDDMREGYLKIYTGFGEMLMGWSNHFRLFVPIAFFYYLSIEEKKKWIIAGLVMCMANYILYWANYGTRGGILSQAFMYLFSFILFMPLFDPTTIRKVKRWIVIASIPMVLFFALITLSRFNSGSSNKTLVGWILLYSSEGPIKFSNEMWDGEHNTNGDVNLCYLKSLVGLKTFTSFEDRDEYYLAKNGRRIENFYTYVGDFVSDFGVFGAFVVCLILTLVTKHFLRKDGVLLFQNLLFVLFAIHMYSIGFASNIYRSNSMQKDNFYLFVVFLIMTYLSKTSKYQITQTNNVEEETLI